MNRRWYDQSPACPKLLRQVHDMPQPEIRKFCANLLNLCSDSIREGLQMGHKKHSGLHSLGISVLTGMYRFGKQKRRWYDSQPDLHKAVGTLYSLPPQGLTLLGDKLGDTFGLIQIYSIVCKLIEQEPAPKDLAKIAQVALNTGTEEAEQLLISIVGQELYESISDILRS